MNLRGKRELLQSFDYLLYCLIQLISSSYTFQQQSYLVIFLIICTVFLLSTCIHLFSTVIGEPGIIIDFIGNLSQQLLDQTNDNTMITHTLQVPPTLAHAFGGASQLRLMIPSTSRSNNNNNNNNTNNRERRRRSRRRNINRNSRERGTMQDNDNSVHNESDQDNDYDDDNDSEDNNSNNGDHLFYHNDLIIDISFNNIKSMLLHSRHSSITSQSDDASTTTLLLPL
ncbi:unnamed protein product [Cunninghamella echinulata]